MDADKRGTPSRSRARRSKGWVPASTITCSVSCEEPFAEDEKRKSFRLALGSYPFHRTGQLVAGSAAGQDLGDASSLHGRGLLQVRLNGSSDVSIWRELERVTGRVRAMDGARVARRLFRRQSVEIRLHRGPRPGSASRSRPARARPCGPSSPVPEVFQQLADSVPRAAVDRRASQAATTVTASPATISAASRMPLISATSPACAGERRVVGLVVHVVHCESAAA